MPNLPSDVVAVVAGEGHALALTATGAVLASGDNSFNQVRIARRVPAQMAVFRCRPAPLRRAARDSAWRIAAPPARRGAPALTRARAR